MDDLTELADALASAKAGSPEDAPVDGAEASTVGGGAVDEVPAAPDVAAEAEPVADATSANDEHEPDEVEFKRIEDAQRAMHEAMARAKKAEAALAERDAMVQDEDEDPVETPSSDELGELIGKDRARAATAYHEALGRPDVAALMPRIIAETQTFDAALAEEMRLEYVSWRQTTTARSAEEHQANITETARQAASDFYEATDDAKDHADAIQGILGHPQNELFHDMLESGDPNQVFTAHQLAYHVARSLSMDQEPVVKLEAAAPIATEEDKAAARGFQQGKGSTRAAAADDGAGDPLAGLTHALEHLQSAG